jgi:hypothetical protein
MAARELTRSAATSAALAWMIMGCGGGAGASAGGLDASSPDASGPAVDAGDAAGGAADAADGADGGDASVPPHVVIRGGALLIDGVPTFLYGGDLHYFRVRAPDYDAATTQAMWASTMDQMRAAGMNLVTTYAPWDYHNTSDGTWDFTGARDLGAFLKLACDKNMWVVLKPGPLITAEWPRGFGTYGAVPEWWKTAHPEAMVKTSTGATWTFSPTGDASQQQPVYLHPTYLAAVKDWYGRVLPIAQPYLRRCLVALQVDNETNGYWGGRFGDVDYSDVSLAYYRSFLAKRYGAVAALNALYGTTYASFDEVAPPTAAPGSATSERANNRWYADWYEAGQAYSGQYLATLRGMMSDAGFAPPDVLYFTNDSPFALTGPDSTLLRDVLLHDGPTKNAIGPAGMDLYPKQLPTNGSLQDQPFQADYFTKAATFYGGVDWAYAAELQGGFYAYPVIGAPTVAPAATDQLLARAVGHGLKGGSFYVVRDGLNADGSAYDYLAPIDANGNTTARYGVLQKWGAFLAAHGDDLLSATEVENQVAVLTNGRYQSPQGGILDDMQRLFTMEMPGIFGWLEAAGIDPAVLDARGLGAGALAKYKVVFYQNPDFVDDATASLLAGYVRSGGVLVDLLWPGRVNDDFVASAATGDLSTNVFPATYQGDWIWPSLTRDGQINAHFGAYDGPLPSHWYESYWSANAGASLAPFALEQTAPLGTDGRTVGYVVKDGVGTRVMLGTNVWATFNQPGYYGLDAASVAPLAQLALWLVAAGGDERPSSPPPRRASSCGRARPAGGSTSSWSTTTAQPRRRT